jgi:hypothetical protein
MPRMRLESRDARRLPRIGAGWGENPSAASVLAFHAKRLNHAPARGRKYANPVYFLVVLAVLSTEESGSIIENAEALEDLARVFFQRHARS